LEQLLTRTLERQAKYRLAEGVPEGGEPVGQGRSGEDLPVPLALDLFDPEVMPAM
jgi:hypothetical protein